MLHRKIYYCIEMLLFIYWINLLRGTHANYIVYLMCAGGAFCSLGIRICREEAEKKYGWNKWNFILAGVFGIFIVLGNYEIVEAFAGIHRLLIVVALFCSSVAVFYNIFDIAYELFLTIGCQSNRIITKKEKRVIFFTSLIILAAIDFMYLFEAVYPGVVTEDSILQLWQIQYGLYSNHHPFYHTMIIKIFYSLGMKLFGDVNAAVATYSVFQICLMALTLSYVVLTVYEISKSKVAVCFVILFYALLPYYWNYSCSIWKDIVFGVACTIFTVSLYRARKRIGNKLLNYILIFLSSIGVCLFRSNGVFVYFITLISLIIVLRNKERKLLYVAVTAFIIALVMKGPILNAMNVQRTDAIEALSIPAQQIARVIHQEQYIEDSDMELLKKVVDVEAVKEQYKPYLSDPVKTLVRQSSGNDVILSNKAEYLELWIRLGLQYPGTYIAAWVEQTRGYWNAGYNFDVCSTMVADNELGVTRMVRSEECFTFTTKVIDAFANNTFLCFFVSIGFCFWIYLVLFWFNISGKWDGWIETVPFIGIIISLCIATPVFSAFRYSFALYLSIPFVIFSGIFNKETGVCRKVKLKKTKAF